MKSNLTIVITTFKYRFENYLKPLLTSIKSMDNDIEVVLTINGEHQEEFDDNYRSELLNFIADKKNVYPVFFPQFRGLSKLWNTGVIHSSNDYVLIMNDDVSFTNDSILDILKHIVIKKNTSFKLNGSFSHFVVKKEEYFDLGMVDERMLGIGEDDAAINWIYNEKYGKDIESYNINGIVNHVDFSRAPTNTKTIATGKYSLFNQQLFYNELFKIDNVNGVQRGICPAKLIKLFTPMTQSFYEQYYLENRHKL